MFVKLIVVACSIALCSADGKWYGPIAGGEPAHRYPAGVSPQACPNFPNCDNPAVAASSAAAGHGGWNGGNNGAWNGGNNEQWNGGNNGQWNGGNNGQWNGGNNGGWNGGNNGQWNGGNNGGWNSGNNGGWNGGQNQWNGNNGQWNGGHAGAPAAAAIPAGVDPSSCPNYPFCK